jgi:hypothetical protein
LARGMVASEDADLTNIFPAFTSLGRECVAANLTFHV